MNRYPRWLFSVAAAANFAVAGWILFAKPLFVALLCLDPITGTNVVVANLAAVLIGGFGYGYARIAADPARFRPLIHVGAVGKLAAVFVVAAAAVFDRRALRLALLIGGDTLFAALFFDYLRRSGRSPAA
jgi:hypothetical protein